MHKDYYVIIEQSEVEYCNGPFTWDEAIHNGARAMDEVGANFVQMIDATKTYVWAEDVLADV
jgi:hypothetical protein